MVRRDIKSGSNETTLPPGREGGREGHGYLPPPTHLPGVSWANLINRCLRPNRQYCHRDNPTLSDTADQTTGANIKLTTTNTMGGPKTKTKKLKKRKDTTINTERGLYTHQADKKGHPTDPPTNNHQTQKKKTRRCRIYVQ